MKIKQKLFLSFAIATMVICFFIILSGISISRKNLSKDLHFSDNLLVELSNNLQQITENSLTEYTKKYLDTKTSNLFYSILPFIKEDKYNPEIISLDKRVIKLLNSPLSIGNHEVGYFVLTNGISSVVVGPPKIIEFSNSFYSQVFQQIKVLNLECLSKGHSEGYYNYIDKAGNKVVRKYATLYKIPNSDLIVTGLLNISEYCERANSRTIALKNDFFNKQRKRLIDYYNQSVINKTIYFILSIIIVLAISILVINSIMNILTGPLIQLTKKIKNFDPNNPDFTIKTSKLTSYEVTELSSAFVKQEAELKQYMQNLKREVESRHLLEHELEVAQKIQNSVLPKITDDFKTDKFSIFAKLLPAKEVAGDFYDFFYLDEKRIVLLIADVSGKGIPAALFMQRAKIIIRASAELSPDSPGEALEKANYTLSKKNEACMFVTVFLVYYNIETGELQYANGGHHSVIKISGENIISFGKLKDIALGTFESSKFKTQTEKLNPGDKLLFFTDGIIEAVSPSFEEFGYSRLQKTICPILHENINILGNKILKTVHDFEVKSQFDDITLLIFERNI